MDNELPGKNVDESASTEAKRYQRQKLVVSLYALGLTLLFIIVMAMFFGPSLDEGLRRLVGANPWIRLAMLGAVYGTILEVLTLPFDFWSGYILEHRYQLSNQTLRGWIWKKLKGYMLGGPLGLALLFGLYTIIWYTGWWWWLCAAAGWLAVSLVLGQLLPVAILPLFYKVVPLDNADLLERLRRLAGGTGLKVQGVYRLQLSTETRKANACLAGLGRTRRVLLGDTLLDQFSPEEIEVVFAHEVGHHVHHHLPKMIALSVVLAGAAFWIADQVLRVAAQSFGYPDYPLQAYADPAALPLLLAVLVVFGLILMPLQNAISRAFERQCDRYALVRTTHASAYRSAFTKLAKMNKEDLEPNPFLVWLFDDHPPIRERLALANAVNLELRP
jgi:STE24 endopeptidase